MTVATQRRSVGVYGASGYTGQQVARRLLERGERVVVCGRTRDSLTRLAAGLPGAVNVATAPLTDPDALAAFARDVGLIINCAGPFSQTALPLCRAALANGSHYLDIAAEQGSAMAVLEHDAEARRAGVALIPAFGFFGALADLLVAREAARAGSATLGAIDVAYSISGWRPSAATVRTRLEGLGSQAWTYDGGLRPQRGLPPTRFFEFPAPLGRKRVAVYPTPEVITLPRHVTARRIQVYMTAATLGPAALGPLLPTVANAAATLMGTPLRGPVESVLRAIWGGKDTGAKQSDPTQFSISLALTALAGTHRASVTGCGVYDLTAVMAVEAALHLMHEWDGRSGALAAGQAFHPASMLARIAQHGGRLLRLS
jgi:short subunit dehydrogenase-like uncharacterized protein